MDVKTKPPTVSPPLDDRAAPTPARFAELERKTRETSVAIALRLDGSGRSEIRTGVPFLELRKSFQGTLLGGLDEKNFRTLDENELKAEWRRAQQQAGTRFILTPGCSVPNDSTDAELNRLVTVLGA